VTECDYFCGGWGVHVKKRCFPETGETCGTFHDRAMELLTRLMAEPEVSALFNCQQLVLQHSLPLGCYLLKPVQRILKYQLLLQVFSTVR